MLFRCLPKALLSLAMLFALLSASGQQRGLNELDSLRAILEEMPPNSAERAQALLELSRVYTTIDLDLTEQLAGEALGIAEAIDNTALRSFACRNIGVVYAIRGQFKEARDWTEKALEFAKMANDQQHQTKAVINLIGIALNQGNLLLAEQTTRELIHSLYVANDTFHLPAVHESIGLTFLRQQRLDSAEFHLRVATRLYEAQDKTIELANCLNSLAGVLEMRGAFDKALSIVQQSVGLYQKVNRNHASGSYLSAKLQQARILLHFGDFAQARAILEYVSNAAAQQETLPYLSMSFLLSSRLDSMQGNLDSALVHLHRYIKTEEKINELGSDQRYQSLLREYQKMQKKSENQRHQAERELAQTQIQNQRMLLFLVLVALGILALLTSELIRRNRQIQQSNERLAHNQTIINLKNQALEENKEVLTAQKQELEKLNQTKDRWFGIISHDFRHPLTLLQGALQLVADDEVSPTERAMLVQELQVRFDRAANLLDNLLFWAQSQLAGWKFHLGRVKAAGLIGPVLDEVDPWIQDKQLRIDIVCPEDLEVVTDPNALHLIIRNLLHNAIKYSHKGKTVFVTVENSENCWTLIVRDEGIGMSEEQVSALFQSEVKSTPGTMNEKGSGLGLLLARDVTVALHGTLNVTSAPDLGTTFTLTLPREDPTG